MTINNGINKDIEEALEKFEKKFQSLSPEERQEYIKSLGLDKDIIFECEENQL